MLQLDIQCPKKEGDDEKSRISDIVEKVEQFMAQYKSLVPWKMIRVILNDLIENIYFRTSIQLIFPLHRSRNYTRPYIPMWTVRIGRLLQMVGRKIHWYETNVLFLSVNLVCYWCWCPWKMYQHCGDNRYSKFSKDVYWVRS